MHRFLIEDDLVLEYSFDTLSKSGSEWAEKDIRRAYVNFTFKNPDGLDTVNSGAPDFKRGEVE